MKKVYKVSYIVTWKYPEMELDVPVSTSALLEYMKQLEEGKLKGQIQKDARWSISSINGNSH